MNMFSSQLIAVLAASNDAVSPTLHLALQISGIALAGIFLVMGLFGGMIVLLTWMFPEREE